jgi:hypothetical protein
VSANDADELPASAGPMFAASLAAARCIGRSPFRFHAFAQCATAGSTVGPDDVVVAEVVPPGVVFAETAGAPPTPPPQPAATATRTTAVPTAAHRRDVAMVFT